MPDKPGGSGLTPDQISSVLTILPTAEDVEVCHGCDEPCPDPNPNLDPNPNPDPNP